MRELTIDAVGAQGDGLSRNAEGKGAAFVPLTLPGERVLANMEGARGEVAEILAPSPDRVTPPCRHFGTCGGCALQHWAAEPYLAWKAEQVRLQLSMEGLETEILPTFAAPPASRRRVALHARKGPKGAGALLGFKERRSWSLVPIKECPVTDPRLVAALPALARLAEPFLEHPKSAPTLHVTLTGTGLDIDVTGVERKSGGLSADARMRAAMAASEGDFARVTLAGETVYGARQPLVKLGQAVVALPPGAFLQAVPAAERAMVDFTVAEAQGASRLADLYCGVGTFTFRLAEIGAVHAAEMSAPAIEALKTAMGSTSGLKPIHAEARDLVRRPVLSTELAKTDVVVIDPPRAGAAEQTVEIAKSKVAKVISVSCNPGTFAKDARALVEAGFRLEKVLPVDQFVWSPHIELVGVFTR
ncbi:class I SAM-dependent RNA methyltransferase [Caulobacter segnis]|uniref:(Uracil-5)-methyltransferase n=2 Tax=Caulobacter segnis TaxID=88688 RepID=D5VJ20_CAUST|nr:class I SAM-dependent RNA methyltransferase [Caulobacter segnis]ADG10108.1 (Uracil-5)-methyltransferase [Caulobacter segnis ATCC 21756]AVQ01856.1 class I SAM-dependent RNA methyltransferase [Caulobacter segnis]